MESQNSTFRKSEDVVSNLGIGAVHFVKEWLKAHQLKAKSIERWDKVTDDGDPTLAYFKVFVSQDEVKVFPDSFPESEVVIIFELHQ